MISDALAWRLLERLEELSLLLSCLVLITLLSTTVITTLGITTARGAAYTPSSAARVSRGLHLSVTLTSLRAGGERGGAVVFRPRRLHLFNSFLQSGGSWVEALGYRGGISGRVGGVGGRRGTADGHSRRGRTTARAGPSYTAA